MATDRRRINGPPGGTAPPTFAPDLVDRTTVSQKRTRQPNELRKIFLKTGLTPSASGSAYLELEPTPKTQTKSLTTQTPSLKLTCTVHGPRPLQRSAPFSPQLLLSACVKFAPFATRQRRGYVPDTSERDLAAHLETALGGVLIGERWPKSRVDVTIIVLEGEEDHPTETLEDDRNGRTGGWGLMSVLSGCITVASAAITDAGIDCIDLVTGGVAAIVRQPSMPLQFVIDPCPSDQGKIIAACVIAYLQSRDEITELWAKGDMVQTNGKARQSLGFEQLVDQAVEAAMAARLVLVDAVKEATESKLQSNQPAPSEKAAAR